jgi:mycothione reductase
MDNFDVLVIGSGSGMLIASTAVAQGLKTALVENGPMGGTCLNRGCVPSKILIYPADLTTMIRNADKLGVNATLNSVVFDNIMSRMRKVVNEDSGNQAKAAETTPQLTWFKDKGEFISDYTMRIGDHTITADKVFIVSGARPGIPPVKGIENVHYLTSDTVLQLQTPPKSIVIIGGGYIGAEYGHFFAGIGTKTTIIQRPRRLIPEEEPEVSEQLKKELEKRIEILTGYEVIEINENMGNKKVKARNRQDGSIKESQAEAVLIATGRVPNSDLLKPEKTGVELDPRGYIKVNEYLETSKKRIWAFGDAIGKKMFKHVANFEAGIAWHNSMGHEHKAEMDYSIAPHAVFTYPQVASVGLREEEANQQAQNILVGYAFYKNTAMGAAMGEPEGFIKVIVEDKTGKILGGHIIGPEASALIQEIVNAMNTEDRSFLPIARAMHIQPALSEVVQQAFGNLHPPHHH